MFPSGEVLATTNTPLDKLFTSTHLAVEVRTNASLVELTRRHAERVAARAPICSARELSLDPCRRSTVDERVLSLERMDRGDAGSCA
jgi:hypothetical protein